MYGSWYFWIDRFFWRWELYFFVSLVTDVPGLFLLYIKHIRSLDFNDETQMPYAQQDSVKDVVVLLTDVDTDFISEYRPNRASAYSASNISSMRFSQANSLIVDPEKFARQSKTSMNTTLDHRETAELCLGDD